MDHDSLQQEPQQDCTQRMKPPEELESATGDWDEDKEWWDNYLASLGQDNYRVPTEYRRAEGGRIGRQEGGLMDLGGMEKDYRDDGGFVPLGGEEKADDVPARLSKNEFVFTQMLLEMQVEETLIEEQKSWKML